MVEDMREPGRDPEQRGKGRMRCPVCDVSLSMADRQGIEIDFCPECRGVWLDRGELDKIVERSAADLAPQPSRDTGSYDDSRGYGKHGGNHGGNHGSKHGGGGYSKHGGGGHGYGRKSWLREIFD